MRTRIAVTLALALSAAGCSDSPTEPPPVAAPRGLGMVRVIHEDSVGVRSRIVVIDPESAEEHTILAAYSISAFSFSPDGRSVVYLQSHRAPSAVRGEIWRAGADGSNRRLLVRSAEPLYGAAWSPDGRWIVYGRAGPEGAGVGLWVMDADGSSQALLFDPGERTGLYEPSWSPDGRWILFGEGVIWDRLGGITLISPRTREIRTIPFPPDSVSNAVCGTRPCFMSPQLLPEGRVGFAAPYYGGPAPINSDLWTMDSQGKDLRRVTQGAQYFAGVWSPDGQMIAAVRDPFDGSGRTIHLLSADGQMLRDLGVGWGLVWRP